MAPVGLWAPAAPSELVERQEELWAKPGERSALLEPRRPARPRDLPPFVLSARKGVFRRFNPATLRIFISRRMCEPIRSSSARPPKAWI